MGSRLELHEKLKSVSGYQHVYYQPPESLKIKHPAIVYGRDVIDNKYADNLIFVKKKRYWITVISSDPDNNVSELFMDSFPYCSFERRYIVDNLYHDRLTLYF